MKLRIMILAWFIPSIAVYAATLYVDLSSKSPVPPYDAWETAATNIQTAVDTAATGDTIVLADGHYGLSEAIVVTNDLAIESINGPEYTSVDGAGGSFRIFHLGSYNCTVSGLSIINSGYSGDGGGMYGGTAVDCTFSNNYAGSSGGALYGGIANHCRFFNNTTDGDGGAVCSSTVYDSVFTNNTGVSGGAMSSSSASNCLFISNHATKNGGGMNQGSAIDSVFTSNTATQEGGGFFMESDSELERCTFITNSADSGGGAFVSFGTPSINNCIFSGNTATTKRGGGLQGGIANNCTFTENTAAYGADMAYGTANNCISWNNKGGNFSSTTTNSCWTTNPLFIDAKNNDLHLLNNSPCIDSGDNNLSGSLTLDRDGNTRIQNKTIDYGAYEFNFPTLTVISAQGSPSPFIGSVEYSYGTTITCTVDSVTHGLTNYSPVGWTLTGQEPSTGITNWFETTLTHDAVLTWNWQTNYWFEISIVGEGTVTMAGPHAEGLSGFYAKDSLRHLVVFDFGENFVGWEGDASGTSSVAVIIMSEPRAVTATFSNDFDGDGLYNSWENDHGSDPYNSDTDRDGFDDLFEFQQGLSLTNENSAIVDYIQNHESSFGLYASNVVLDVALGKILLDVTGSNASLNLQLKESENLVTWTNAGPPKVWSWPVGGEKKFFRVKSNK